jgi:hypothetical protein
VEGARPVTCPLVGTNPHKEATVATATQPTRSHERVTLDDGTVYAGLFLGRIASPVHGEVVVLETPRGLFHIPTERITREQVIA